MAIEIFQRSRASWTRRLISGGAALTLAVGLVGCSSSETVTVAPQAISNAPQWDGTFGVRAVNPQCRGNMSNPQPGDVICLSDSDDELNITTGGSPGAPITYTGTGKTKVAGIRAQADNIVIQGFLSEGAKGTGIWAAGKNVTIQDNIITQVEYSGDDVDAIRFFGDGARVLHNWVYDLEGSDVEDSHVDCMQTFATSRPGSQNVVIQGNKCEGIRAQCLMAEGPSVKDGSGDGVSQNWLIEGNYCDSHAKSQSVSIQDVQNVTISRNRMVGEGNKAFALGQGSTNAVVTEDNEIGPGYKRTVEFDDPSARAGYKGPPAE